MNKKPLSSQAAPPDNLIWFWEEITAVPDDILPELLAPSLDDLWDNTNAEALMAYLDEFLQQSDELDSNFNNGVLLEHNGGVNERHI